MSEVESRTQGSRPRSQKNPRPRPRTALPRTNTLEAKDRNVQDQGKGPRRQAQVLSEKKSLQENFSGVFQKTGFKNFFSGDLQKLRSSKTFFRRATKFLNSENCAVLVPRTAQFSRTWGFDAEAKDLTFKAKDFKMCPRVRPQGQGRPRGLRPR